MSVQKWACEVEDASNRAATAPKGMRTIGLSLFVGWTGLWWACGYPCKLGQLREGSPLVLHHIVYAKIR